MHAAQLRKKLGVLDPSREERYSKRIRNADDSSNPSPGTCGRLVTLDQTERCVLAPQPMCGTLQRRCECCISIR